jgi:hypothetical protein
VAGSLQKVDNKNAGRFTSVEHSIIVHLICDLGGTSELILGSGLPTSKPTGKAVFEGFKSGDARSVTPATCLKLLARIIFPDVDASNLGVGSIQNVYQRG